jgi:hypothetical protein
VRKDNNAELKEGGKGKKDTDKQATIATKGKVSVCGILKPINWLICYLIGL